MKSPGFIALRVAASACRCLLQDPTTAPAKLVLVAANMHFPAPFGVFRKGELIEITRSKLSLQVI